MFKVLLLTLSKAVTLLFFMCHDTILIIFKKMIKNYFNNSNTETNDFPRSYERIRDESYFNYLIISTIFSRFHLL